MAWVARTRMARLAEKISQLFIRAGRARAGWWTSNPDPFHNVILSYKELPMATRSPYALSLLAAVLAVGPLAAGDTRDHKAGKALAMRTNESLDGNDDRSGAGPDGLPLARKPRCVPGELLVQFRIGATAQNKLEAMLPIKGRSVEAIRLADARLASMASGVPLANVRGDLERVSLPDGITSDEAIRVLKMHPDVEFAQPNWIYHSLATPNDPRYAAGNLWGLYGPATSPSNAYGLNALAAWNAGFIGSRNVYVAVIDEGAQWNHPDLIDNFWTNPFEIAGDGIDNDSNGFIDDIHGWDFGNNDNSVYDGPASGTTSTDKHGTHVSGTIGATGNNGIGSVGVCWQVSIISAKFLLAGGGTGADMIRALDYITDLKTRHGLDIVATNNSYGGDPFGQAELDAITRSAQANILYIAAAGNDSANNDSSPHYPSNYDTTTGAGYNNVIAVAAITSGGSLASYSDYGATTVHLGAPGSSISSTIPANSYGSLDGTSMATPHVTGAAALIAAATGKRGNALRQAILDNVKPLSSLNGRTTTGGRLDLSFLGSTATAPTITSQPANATVNAGATATFNVSVSGTAPFTYQWRKNSANITGATAASYTTPATTSADSGATFSVVVTNSVGSATSANATLTVNAATAPTITTQPASQSVTAGATATFSVGASGTAPFTYQWRKNGTAIVRRHRRELHDACHRPRRQRLHLQRGGEQQHGQRDLGQCDPHRDQRAAQHDLHRGRIQQHHRHRQCRRLDLHRHQGHPLGDRQPGLLRADASPGQKLSINMTGPTGVDWDLALKNSAGTNLASSTGGTATESLSYTNTGAAAMTVYANVYVYSGTSATPYNLALALCDAAPQRDLQ